MAFNRLDYLTEFIALFAYLVSHCIPLTDSDTARRTSHMIQPIRSGLSFAQGPIVPTSTARVEKGRDRQYGNMRDEVGRRDDSDSGGGRRGPISGSL